MCTIQKAAADDLKKTADDYRRKEMFDMRAFNATHIEITRDGKTTAWDKVKGTGENAADTWKRVSPAAGEPDKDKFQAFVAALADIRSVSFVDSKAKTGLENPAATIVDEVRRGQEGRPGGDCQSPAPTLSRPARTTPAPPKSTAPSSTRQSSPSTSSQNERAAPSSRPLAVSPAGVPRHASAFPPVQTSL